VPQSGLLSVDSARSTASLYIEHPDASRSLAAPQLDTLRTGQALSISA
jgi:ethanolamine ammonia-lyase small subunit